MKYSNTSRVLSLLFHSLIFAAFGSMGLYFGFFVVPEYFNTATQAMFTENLFKGAFNLYLELAVLGLSLMTVSAYGLFQAIVSILRPSDDQSVIKSFVAFIGDGYVLSIFFLLQGLLFFDLIANSNVAFVIVMAILFAILLLIATNIPMVRLFDGKDNTPLLAGLSLTAGVTFAWGAIDSFLALIGSWNAEAYNGQYWINIQLGIGSLSALFITGLVVIAGIIILKKGANDSKASAISGYLNSGAVLLLSGLLFSLSVIEIVLHDTEKVHMESSSLSASSYGYGFGIMGLVLASLALLSGIYFIVVTAKESQKKTLQTK
jgi:hypothetical protein